MNCCGSTDGAAYSRRVWAWVGGTRTTLSGKTRGGLLERCLYSLRFVLGLSVLFPFEPVAGSSANPHPAPRVELPVIRWFAPQTSLPGRPPAQPQTATPQTSLPGRSPSDSQTSEQTKTEQYTLSHERYEKAVAYSRAGYTLYFVAYFLSAVFLLLILRFGLAARFRDIAENVSDRRWIQGLVFVSILFITIDFRCLP